jgi:hypothetical protein
MRVTRLLRMMVFVVVVVPVAMPSRRMTTEM